MRKLILKDGTELKEGDRIKCKIRGCSINDAMLSADIAGRWHVCQNYIEGHLIKNRHGYKYSYMIEVDNIDGSIYGASHIELFEPIDELTSVISNVFLEE